jgi:hypothetical protein
MNLLLRLDTNLCQCGELCISIFQSVDEATLRFQILRCIPQTSPRSHELRRRLALAFFFDDVKYSVQAPEVTLDLRDITRKLNEPQFKLDRESDYHELSATISILDIAIDNGQSLEKDITIPKYERAFNEEVDELAARIYVLWSSINDAGAAFFSRIDAKQVMDGLRQRLLYAVRTELQPKLHIFDSTPDDSDNSHMIRKQGEFMKKIFKHKAELP